MGAPRPGRYVVLEGGEGTGKTTQADRLAKRLSETGRRVRVVREPGGDPFAEAGRELLLGPIPRTPEAEVLAFNAMRAQLLVAVVRPLLAGGTWVIADRGRLSTLAYQGHGRGVDLEWARSVCDVTVSLCPPDLEVVLAVDPAVSAARRSARGVTDRFEAADDHFHQRVNEGFATEAARAGVAIVDGTDAPSTVTERLWHTLTPRLG
ncbi:MAG: dTMP kinase [Acidimicrobiia bacterium]|nr:dTMP kinase [Acidimicrobiia bacterium]